MTPRTERQQQIEDAAYRVLERRGFAGATMLAIAREARASHETLYRWYGDKTGLFRALVVRNAEAVRQMLTTQIARGHDPMQTLARLGPDLVDLLTHPRAIALNRAAAADPGGDLAAAIAAAGRGTIGPLIAEVLVAARDRGALRFDDPQAALGLYLDLLVGDLQHRRVIGLDPPPDADQRQARAAQALDRLRRLLDGRDAA
ncbi:TetR/AcrR family transcriptional regulator [Paracoccus spongiarum]|uniref:TetR/AcrR family transcriptional regulator n=1 Tax=Paracoccus spongiarum TaxID=3064387 RepID=A0ABT9J7M3_9RHOB|nr:TetR/AcrR family transcriptional regulator [Paracoccus sp. 2205BS29-5]MDP5305808.1 TetR/AcrR family transcriptional regulator [Paracoccus sp. 2205BS29-5]